MSEPSAQTYVPMTDDDVDKLVDDVFENELPGSPAKPTDAEYTSVTDKVVEVRTPTSQTRFHVPNEKVELEREKLDIARQERQVQGVRVHFPNPRFR
jgi:acetylornithine deacetylase/succinyl-diaminopimelate desuccinylase-like protein